jgi:hypothetical protein
MSAWWWAGRDIRGALPSLEQALAAWPQVLREARIAFLEEELPALVAKGATMEAIRKRCATINAKLGEKFEITDTELVGS